MKIMVQAMVQATTIQMEFQITKYKKIRRITNEEGGTGMSLRKPELHLLDQVPGLDHHENE